MEIIIAVAVIANALLLAVIVYILSVFVTRNNEDDSNFLFLEKVKRITRKLIIYGYYLLMAFIAYTVLMMILCGNLVLIDALGGVPKP